MLLPTYGGEKPDVEYQAFFLHKSARKRHIKMVLRKSSASVSDIIPHFMIVRRSMCVHEYLAQWCLQIVSMVVAQPTTGMH